MLKTKLAPIPKTVPAANLTTVPSVEDCETSQGHAKIRALTKNKKNINRIINRHKYEVHGIPQPQQQQQQQKPRNKGHKNFKRFWRTSII